MYDKERIVLDYEDEDVKFDLKLYHTINVVTGDSGIGKTHFCSRLANLRDDGINPLEKQGFKIILYNSDDFFVESIKDGKFLYIIDDSPNAVYAKGFFKKAYGFQEAVFLILSRSIDQGSFSIDCFTDAIYTLEVTEKDSKCYFNFKKYTDTLQEV